MIVGTTVPAGTCTNIMNNNWCCVQLQSPVQLNTNTNYTLMAYTGTQDYVMNDASSGTLYQDMTWLQDGWNPNSFGGEVAPPVKTNGPNGAQFGLATVNAILSGVGSNTKMMINPKPNLNYKQGKYHVRNPKIRVANKGDLPPKF